MKRTGSIQPPFVCGYPFFDSRNNKTYATVLIGTQCWFAENLNIGARVNGSVDQANNSIIEKYCYGDNDANCTTYGGLYQWDEMMQYSTDPGVKGICPSGWHLPADAEWTTLTTCLEGISVAGGKMKEAGTTHWTTPNEGATNSSGFTGLPGGKHGYVDASFSELSNDGNWWSSTSASTPHAWLRSMSYNTAEVIRSNDAKGDGYSVRCLRN